MTIDQIMAETDRLAPEQLAVLAERVAIRLHGGISPVLEEGWRQETRHRLADIESGRDPGIPGEEVSARIRKIVGR